MGNTQSRKPDEADGAEFKAYFLKYLKPQKQLLFQSIRRNDFDACKAICGRLMKMYQIEDPGTLSHDDDGQTAIGEAAECRHWSFV